jgi:hypothetical protein
MKGKFVTVDVKEHPETMRGMMSAAERNGAPEQFQSQLKRLAAFVFIPE